MSKIYIEREAVAPPEFGFEQHFQKHINVYADKHPTMLVRQLAGLLRAAWAAKSAPQVEPSQFGSPEMQPLIVTKALQAAPGAVLEGWQLVPVEPTLAMLDALRADTTPYLPERYRAMLSAAPNPQVSKPQDTPL